MSKGTAISGDDTPAPNRIREMRTRARMSQVQLAAALNSGPTQVYKLETGQRQLTQEWMERIARVLGCAPADLLAPSLSAEEEELLRIYRSLSPEDKAWARETIARARLAADR